MSEPLDMNEATILNGDSLNVLKTIKDETVDAVITDPPYGYSFMYKDWDKAVPSVDIWRECLRVLKPGGWCMVMSAPRSDVQNAMISRLMEAGFRLDFTPIYWTYASGFPKAGNVGKLVDKRLGAEREMIPVDSAAGTRYMSNAGNHRPWMDNPDHKVAGKDPVSPQAKALDGSYTGFQPKPAVEVVIVAMKPLSEKTYVDQALKNGKGITWLDDGRIPTDTPWSRSTTTKDDIRGGNTVKGEVRRIETGESQAMNSRGRFPANLLVSDEALNGHSKFFDLDAWAEAVRGLSRVQDFDELPDKVCVTQPNSQEVNGETRPEKLPMEQSAGLDKLPFLIVPKASKSEKNAGTDKNHHPTVKPLKLMSYLITLTTREGDTVLDPFVGSGTTVVAAKQLGRIGIGIEREQEYAVIAAARLAHKQEKAIEQTSLLG
jgi:hypothetical protein